MHPAFLPFRSVNFEWSDGWDATTDPVRGAKHQAEDEYLSSPATPALIVRSMPSPPAPMRPPPTPLLCGAPRLIAEMQQILAARKARLARHGPLLSGSLCRLPPEQRPQRHSSPRRMAAGETTAGSLSPQTMTASRFGTVDPPSLRINDPPSLPVNCEAPSSRQLRCVLEFELKTMPVPFIRVSEPWPEPDNEATLVGGKRKW
ncbi:hypothetical protein K438DRAFT_1986043 [Mycena galopus ATCC 62051]|nr:hypothetical protein K438DRAFT_1986043 [Mycena galopus ATCC 62051]